MFNLDDAFYRPLWLRILLVAVCLGWAAFEFMSGAPLFGVIFAALGLYAAWRFFVTFDPPTGSGGEE